MIFSYIKKKQQEYQEIEDIRSRNIKRRQDINYAIKIAILGEQMALSSSIRSKHSRFRARAEAIRDRLDNIDTAIKIRDLDKARAIDKAIEKAIDALNYSDVSSFIPQGLYQ